MKRAVKSAYLGIVTLFLYLPLVVLIIYSFNDAKHVVTWKDSPPAGTPSWSKRRAPGRALNLPASGRGLGHGGRDHRHPAAIALPGYRFRAGPSCPVHVRGHNSPDIVMASRCSCSS
jgi:ABC-type glycerol-3-phosphate transport system permease component